MIGVSIDSRAVMAKLRKLEAEVPAITSHSIEKVADEIMRLSQIEVPHDEGTLQNSGNVEPSGDDWIIGYHTPYAARLHEHPEYHFQRGRKGKYLEDPINRNADVLGLHFVDNFRGEMES